MTTNGFIRQAHRWLSIGFTVAFLIVWGGMALGRAPAWLVYLPLGPLALLVPTGLWLFSLPWRGRRRA